MTVKMGPLDSYCIFLSKISVVTFLTMFKVQAETCSIHGKVTNLIKIKLCCVGLNKCGLLR